MVFFYRASSFLVSKLEYPFVSMYTFLNEVSCVTFKPETALAFELYSFRSLLGKLFKLLARVVASFHNSLFVLVIMYI